MPNTLNPQQKTFFTDRLFVLYDPDDYRRFLRAYAEPHRGNGVLSVQQERAAEEWLEAWATVLIYRSHLEMFGFRQRMFKMFDADGEFLRDAFPVSPLNSTAERQAIAMQLAIETMTQRSEIRARIDENPYYARLIYDTFYYLDFRHEEGGEITLTAERLGLYLRKLAGGSDERDPGDLLGKGTLFDYMKDYVRLLADPAGLKREVLTRLRSLRPEAARIRRSLADCIEMEPIVEIISGTPPGAYPEPPEATLWFRFTADRYGYREGRRSFDVNAAVQALRQWLSLMDETFGGRNRAWDLASEAWLTPRQPSWADIAQLIEDAEFLLGPFRPPSLEAVMPGVLKMVPAPVDPPPDSDETAALADRVYRALASLGRFAQAFELGLLFASFGAMAAPGKRADERFMTGLRALSRLQRPQAGEGPDLVLRTLRQIQCRPEMMQSGYLGSAEDRSLGTAESWLRDMRATIEEQPKEPDFTKDLAAFSAWVERLRKLTPEPSKPLPAAAEISSAYWLQWFQQDGVLRRLGPSAEAATPTRLDMLHAASHGGVPLVPGDGILLSVAELARIRLLYEVEKVEEAAPFAAFAGRLLAALPPARSDARTRWPGLRPVVLISPLSADSPCWSWRPEPGISATALVPPDALGTMLAPLDLQEKLFRVLVAEARALERDEVQTVAAIETNERAEAFSPSVRRRLFFGYGAPPEALRPYVRSPAGLASLLVTMRRASPDFFAQPQSFWMALLRGIFRGPAAR